MGTTEVQKVGNWGGRPIMGCSCMMIVVAFVLLVMAYGMPWVSGGEISPSDVFRPFTDGCGWSCCCCGFVGVMLGVGLMFFEPRQPAQQ